MVADVDVVAPGVARDDRPIHPPPVTLYTLHAAFLI
jgi:hypothetical protein